MNKVAYLVDASSWFHIAWSQAAGWSQRASIASDKAIITAASSHLAKRAISFTQEIDEYANGLDDVALIAALDTGKTWRHEVYPAYKGKRPKKSEAQRTFFDSAAEVLSRHGFELYASKGHEADDVIATMTTSYLEKGEWSVRILSDDHDIWQLAQPNVEIVLREKTKRHLLTHEQVETRLSFPPTRLPTLKALVGDTSDNLPGVKGMGDVYALPLVRQWATVDEIYDHLEEIPERPRKLLEPMAAQLAALTFEDLATLRRDASLEKM